MSAYVTMPQLSDTMTDGTVVKWVKKEGEKVRQGEVIAEVETDKATMEMEAFDSGILAVAVAKEGEKVLVGHPIAVLATGKETVEEARAWHQKQGGATTPAVTAPPVAVPVAAPVAADDSKTEMEENAAGEVEKEQPHSVAVMESPRSAAGSSPASAPPTKDNGDRPQRVSPLARRMAQDKGIDLNRIQGSGPNGRIIERDLAQTSSSAPAAASQAAVSQIAPGKKEIIPLSKMRLTIAKRLVLSKQSIPHFYETIDVDVEDLSALRSQMNKRLAKESIKVSIGDFVARAVVLALAEHPALNATFDGSQITRMGDVNLGMAVAIPDGLIVPVLKNANRLSIREIRQRSVDLADRARAQRLKQDEMTGATFTVSNLGAYGIREFSAIVNPPEVAILAVGAAEKRPTVYNDAVVARTMMTLTLSADHRVVDGATAAEFLRTLKSLLHEPGMLVA